LCSDCPKDPNTRSKFDPLDELKRISDLQTTKKASPSRSFHPDYLEKNPGFGELIVKKGPNLHSSFNNH